MVVCLYVLYKRLISDLSRVFPASCPMTAGIGYIPLWFWIEWVQENEGITISFNFFVRPMKQIILSVP